MAMAAPAPLRLATLFLSILFLSCAVQSAAAAAEQNNAFHFIEHLAGSRKGRYVRGITKLKKYMKEFGYLSHKQQENDLFDDALESAIKGYQLNFHMKATGKMDSDTVKQMMIPRCGIADRALSDQKSRQRPFSKTDLTYKFNSHALISIGEINIRSIFEQAFQIWADVTDFTFEEVPENSPADIEIKFGSGRHGDNSPFDGAGGVFGHVWRPETGRKPLEIHLDADEKWSTNLGMDSESVAIHEIGHLLGLDHNTENPDAIMYPSIDSGMVKRHLHQDDISAVHAALYGLN